MALSMSVSGGAVNARHDLDPEYRARLQNVDHTKTKDNLILASESIEHAYERLFGEATETYNARQVSKGRPDRQIEDYYAHVRDAYRADRAKVGHSKSRSGRPAPAVEYVVQLGNRETWSSELDEAGAKAVYSEAFDRIKARTAGAIDWFAAAVHVDETDGTPHMHIIGIPYGESPNRGLPVQVSMNKALKTMGLDRLPDLQDAMMGCLEDAARDRGVERAVMDDHHRHMDVPQFKRVMRELDQLDDKKEASRREASDLARLADVTRELARDAQAEERAARAGLEGLQREGGAAQGRIGELERAVAAERDRIDLENQVVEFFEGCRDSRDAFERIDRLKKEVEESEREADRGEVKAANLENRADRASEQVAELRERVEGLEAQRSGLVESIERLGRRIADTARKVTDKIKALFERDETPAKVKQYAGSALSHLPVEQQAEVEAARAASAARVAEARRRLAPALEAYRADVQAYRREFAAVAKSAAGTDYSEFPRPRVPVPDDELAKYEPLAADTYIAAKTACDRLVDKYAVNLPDGGDLNDGSTGTATASAAQQTRALDRSIERSTGVRDR